VRSYQDAHPDLTLAQIAQRIGVSLRTLRNARVGEHAATLDTAESVAKFFELEMWQLFMEDLPAEILLNPRLARIVRNVVRAAVQERVEERTGTR
jgi:DNA-binding XRE family transcriptional regulator